MRTTNPYITRPSTTFGGYVTHQIIGTLTRALGMVTPSFITRMRLEKAIRETVGPIKGWDLRGVDLRGMKHVSHVTFQNCNFQGANLSGLDLSEATFSKCYLEGANFSGCKLNQTSIRFPDRAPSGGPFQGCNFEGAEVFPKPRRGDHRCYTTIGNQREYKELGSMASEYLYFCEKQKNTVSLDGAHLNPATFIAYHEKKHPQLHLAIPFIKPDEFNTLQTAKLLRILREMKHDKKSGSGADKSVGRLQIRTSDGQPHRGSIPAHIYRELDNEYRVIYSQHNITHPSGTHVSDPVLMGSIINLAQTFCSEHPAPITPPSIQTGGGR